MLSCKTNKIILRVVCGVLICGLLLSGAGIPSYAVTNPSDSALAPPLATKPPCEIVQKSDGSYDVVTNNDGIESWDRETARSVKAGETLGKAFRNRWAFVDISYLIGQMLLLTQEQKLQNPKDILIPLIKKHIRNRDGMAEILLDGYDIDSIEDVREGGEITGFSLPVTRNGTPAYKLIYNLQGGDTPIPMSNGTTVYVRAESIDNDTVEKAIRILASVSTFTHGTNEATNVGGAIQNVLSQISVANYYVKTNRRIIDEIYREMTDEKAPASKVQKIILLAGEAIQQKNFQPDNIMRWKSDVEELYGWLERIIASLEQWQKETLNCSDEEKTKIRVLLEVAQDAQQKLRDRLLLMEGKTDSKIFSLNKLFDEVLGNVNYPYGKFRPNIIQVNSPKESVFLKGNSISIMSLLCNIANNAIHYSENDDIKVAIDAKVFDGWVVVTISDNGRGIPQERIQRIWKPFQTTGGTGIGLTEAQLIVKDHGGIIDVQSEIGKGTVFSIKLPIAKSGDTNILMRDGAKVYVKIDILGKENSEPKNANGASERIEQILQEIELRRNLLQQLEKTNDGKKYFRQKYDYALSDYLLRLELLHSLGVLEGNVLYPHIGNDYFPAYFANVLGLNSKIGLAVEVTNLNSLEEEANERGLPSAYKNRRKNLRVLPIDSFEPEEYFPEIVNMGGVKTLIIKGLTHWSHYYGLPDGLSTAVIDRRIISLIKSISKDLIEEGGFIVIADYRDLWLGEFLIEDLGYSDLLAQPQYKRLREVLSEDKRSFNTYFGKVESVLGTVPIRVFKKPSKSLTDTIKPQSQAALPSPESEQVHRQNLFDIISYIQAQPQTQPLIVALGTSWIKGYEQGRYLQYDALNPLIGSLRSYCDSKGIPFIIDDDDKLLARINAERAKEGKTNAKVVVLAGEDTVKSDNFATLRNDEKNAFVVGVNSQEMTVDSYMRIIEMLTMALKLSAGLEITQDSTPITITKDDKYKIYIFIPHAEPMDYERLKMIYEVQKFA